MTVREVLETLTLDEREAFLLSSAPSVAEAFDCAATFGDADSIRSLRVALAPVVRDREFQRAIEIFESFKDDQDERGGEARLMLRAREIKSGIPEAAFPFLDAFAAVAATCLRDSRTGAGRRRARLITELLDEAKQIEERRRAA